MSAAANLELGIEIPRLVAVVEPACPRSIAAEVARLPDAARLACSGALEAYLVEASEIPVVLREIGRLRELTFRAVGEGTGKALDLDAFDAHYRHLFVWDAEKARVVGAYRCVESEAVRRRLGPSGLYSSTLFDYGEGFFDRLGPAIELGRSFVRPEYQRVSRALLLLWRAIGAMVARQPTASVLFGPVSISASYRALSRELMVEYLSTHRSRADLRSEVTPRLPVLVGNEARQVARQGRDEADRVAWLSAQVEQLEGPGNGIPVLVHEYLKLGGSFAAFNRDPSFSDVIDGLVVVDLCRTEPKLLSFYMGKETSQRFLAARGGAKVH